MKRRVAVVGAGTLGARHLQSLARLDRPLTVDVVDPSAASLQRAAALLHEAGGLKAGECNMRSDISELAAVPDLAIVATNSRERRPVVARLIEMGVPRMILEKVLFTRLADYDAVDALIARNNVQAWVNCARRSCPRATDLAALIDRQQVDYTVSGAGWGLASNLVHHLDEFAMFCGSDDLELSASKLLPGTYPSKRGGYIEFFGEIQASAPNGSRLTAICREGSEAISGDRVVSIHTNKIDITMRLSEQTMTVRKNGAARTEPYPVPLQSEAMASHVASIFDNRPPAIPDYATAAKLHRGMLAAFLEQVRRTSGDPLIDECPIT